MYKRSHVEIMYSYLQYLKYPKGYKDLTTFDNAQNSKINRKILRALINAEFITLANREYFLSASGIVLENFIHEFLLEWKKK